LRRLDPRAARRLALNQLLLGAVIAGYAGFMIVRSILGPGALSSGSSDPQVAQMLGSFDGLARDITIGFYAIVLLVGIVVTGLTALYYASRKRHIEWFVRSAAPWIVDLHRKGLSV